MQAQTQTHPPAADLSPPPPGLEPAPMPAPLIVGWRFHTGAAIVNYLHDRLQLQFDFGQHPDDDQKRQLRKHGFRFAKSLGFAWQRALDMEAVQAAAEIPWLWPLSEISPVELQPELPRRDLPPWAY